MEEDMASLWTHQEGIEELKHQLLYTTLELESARMEANEEVRKNKETVKHLIQLLKAANQERDEAKDQLQKLLTKVLPSSPTDVFTNLPHIEPETPLVLPNKTNSSITESNSLSDTYNHPSHGSSPVESFFDPVSVSGSTPDFSNINMADSNNINAHVNQPLVLDHQYNASIPTAGLIPLATPKIDHASLVMDNLVKGKALPQKGKLLQAVMEAGPLLETLFFAGPLPQWRNPPPPQPLKVPPISIKRCDSGFLGAKATANPCNFAPRLMNSPVPFLEMACGSSQMHSNPMLNFAGGHPGSCLSSMPLLTTGANLNIQLPNSKRQRLQ
ncbi:uncharacterized protein LOC131148789 [Malania oleifera]|uniref:uncharacterized protein LOC131148789 n=1 Tax=Malania oleifera TaxID=397392 RepID=UPI0025AEAAD4|nr:uncharacterized protein LOC131148789 [Malania oleifera]